MYCPKCGKSISDDVDFCQYCGNELKSNNMSTNGIMSELSKEALNQKPSPKMVALIIALAVLIIILVINVSNFGNQNHSTSSNISQSASVPDFPDPADHGFKNQPSKITSSRPVVATRYDKGLTAAKTITGYYRKALQNAGFKVEFDSDNSDSEMYDYGYILYYNDKIVGIYGETTIIDDDGDYFTMVTISTQN